MEEVSVPSLEEEVLEVVPKSESLEFSVATLPYITAAVGHVISSDDTNVIATDTSPKQVYSESSEEKFNAFEEATDSLPQTGMHSIKTMVLISGCILHTHNIIITSITGETQNTCLKMLF
jgi:hypothetical protein